MTSEQKESAIAFGAALKAVWASGLTVWEYGHSFFVATHEAYETGLEAVEGEDKYISRWIMDETDEMVYEFRKGGK